MTMENMNVTVEVWPIRADQYGLWLVSGEDAWRSSPIGADSDPHFEVELLLSSHDMPPARLLHSTSWRPDNTSIVLTYIAVLETSEPSPGARPITCDLLADVGNPTPHGAADAPIPRYSDVLHHGLRHLSFLLNTDAEAANAIAGWCTHWVSQMQPALAGMYSQVKS